MAAVLTAGLVVVAVPASASANQRYASPAGSGTTCSQVSPCSLVTAVNSAPAGDEVIVAGDQGSYGTSGTPISTPLSTATSVNVHGAAGQPMPVIYSNAAADAIISNTGGTLSDLHIENVSSGGTAVFVSSNADHLIARGGGEGCVPLPSATFIDTVCAGGSFGIGVSSGTSGAQTMTFRNVTAVGNTSYGISIDAAGFPQTINATNVIARGGFKDVATSQSGGGSVTLTLDHSNYVTTQAGAGTTITAAGSGTNQTATPSFVNSAAGDFHQLPASPTIDAGADSLANGTTDFEGKPRTFGTRTDIGADEYAPPSVLSESASSITTQSALLAGSVNTEGGAASARIDYGTTTAYGSSVATGSPRLSASPQTVGATAGGLSPSTTYHYRVVVGNGSGTVAGPDQTFTTAAIPTPTPTPTPTKATLSALGETNSVFAVGGSSTPLTGRTAAKRHKQGTVFSFRLDQPATVKIAIQARAGGRRAGRTCKPDSRKLRHKPRCTRTVTIATLTRTAHAGLNKVAFSGRIRVRALKPGRYQAVFTAVDAAGASASRSLGFTIVKR